MWEYYTYVYTSKIRILQESSANYHSPFSISYFMLWKIRLSRNGGVGYPRTKKPDKLTGKCTVSQTQLVGLQDISKYHVGELLSLFFSPRNNTSSHPFRTLLCIHLQNFDHAAWHFIFNTWHHLELWKLVICFPQSMFVATLRSWRI